MADKVTLFCLFRFLWSAEMRQIRAGIISHFLTLHRCGELIWPKPTCSRCTMGRSGTAVRGKPQVCTDYLKPFSTFIQMGEKRKITAWEYLSCLNFSLFWMHIAYGNIFFILPCKTKLSLQWNYLYTLLLKNYFPVLKLELNEIIFMTPPYNILAGVISIPKKTNKYTHK